MDGYKRELDNIYNVTRETAAMLMICERLDRIGDMLELLTCCTVDTSGDNLAFVVHSERCD